MLQTKGRFNKHLNITFPVLNNKIYLRYKGLFYTFSLPTKGTYISFLKEAGGVNDFKLMLFIDAFDKVHKLFRLFYMFRGIAENNSTKITGFYRIMDLVGLGFRITRVTKSVFFLDIGYSTGVYLFVPNDVEILFSYSTKKLIIFSANIGAVSSIISSLMLLRGPHTYKIRGFIDNNVIVRLRTGKQR